MTRYFFAARLKFSRFMFVCFTTDMREETLLRCLIAAFTAIGGVPWVVTTDNMKTAVLGRDTHNQPIWHPAFARLAAEFRFHPEACTPGAPNQKGAVENLVKFVQTNCLAGRSFYDDTDLAVATTAWLEQVNTGRLSAATAQTPASQLPAEQAKFNPLPAHVADYGFFDSCVVTREGLVTLDSNRYSVPVAYGGAVVSARVYRERVELFVGATRIAEHGRPAGHGGRVVDPAHFAPVFVRKPRVMVYRDWLVALDPAVADFVSAICQSRRDEMAAQSLELYDTAQRLPRADFVSALELAAEQQVYGAEYVRAIAQLPARPPLPVAAESAARRIPAQHELERPLAQYEAYVANASALRALEGEELR